MGSMGETDRKRRHFNSLSHTPATAKKLPFLPISEDKKLDIAVLHYQNQKLTQKLETQKLEYASLENKFSQLKERQQSYGSTLAVVKKSWEQLVNDLESCSERTRESRCKADSRFASSTEDGSSSTVQDVFLSRLLQTGATDTSSTYHYANEMEQHREITAEKAKSILNNIVTSINNFQCLKDGFRTALLKKLQGDVSCGQKLSNDLDLESKNLRLALSELHLKHKSLASDFRIQRDLDAKNKAELKRLKGYRRYPFTTAEFEGEEGRGAKLGQSMQVETTLNGSDLCETALRLRKTALPLLDTAPAPALQRSSSARSKIWVLQRFCLRSNTIYAKKA